MQRRLLGNNPSSPTDLEAFTCMAFAPLVKPGFCWEGLATYKQTTQEKLQ